MTKKTKQLFLSGATMMLLLGSSGAMAHDSRHGHNAHYSGETYHIGECRDYKQNVWIGVHQKTVTGTACFKGNGAWKIVTRSAFYSSRHNAGPIVILPKKQKHKHHHNSHVVYKKSPTVIYTSPHHHGWAYHAPVKNVKKKHHNHKKHYKKNHSHHNSYKKYEQGGITFEFNW